MRDSDLDKTSHRDELARGWSGSSNLLSSVIAGLLIGLGIDALLGTAPVFVVALILVAAVGGFYRTRAEASDEIDAQAREAIRIRDGL